METNKDWKEALEEYFDRKKNGHVRVVPERLIPFIEQTLASHTLALLEEMREAMPKEKDIMLNKVGSVGDYHTHGFNEFHDRVRDWLTTRIAAITGNTPKGDK